MNKIYTNIIAFLSTNKRVFAPLIPLVLLVALITFLAIVFLLPSSTSQPAATITPSPTTSAVPTVINRGNSSEVHENERLYETNPQLQKKEQQSDNIIKYTIASGVSNRPNIIIVQGDSQSHIFERSITPPNAERVSLSEYLGLWGQSEQTLQGSHFYGPQVAWYLYSTQGFAFAADPNKDSVLEVHTFAPMSTQEYLQQYGEDTLTK